MVLEEVSRKPKTKAKAPVKRGGRVATAKSKAVKTEAENVAPPFNLAATAAGECSTLLKQKGNVLRLKAHNLSMQRKCEQAEALLKEAAKLPVGHQEAVVHGLTEARHLFQEALILMGSDPVFSVLQDSSMLDIHHFEDLTLIFDTQRSLCPILLCQNLVPRAQSLRLSKNQHENLPRNAGL